MGNHPMVCRLLNGLFNLRPPIKTLFPMRSVRKVIGMLRLWGLARKLDLRTLTYNTLMLLALTTARGVSSLVLLSLKPGNCEIGDSSNKFQLIGLEKQTHVDHVSLPIQVEGFEDILLDPVAHVK